jgi:hypothetical protein
MRPAYPVPGAQGVAVGNRRDQRLWTSWDDAWEWAVKETDLP